MIWLKRQFKKESVLMVTLALSAFIDVISLMSIFFTLEILEYKFLVGLCKLTIYVDNKILEFKNEILFVSKIKKTYTRFTWFAERINT